MAQQLSSDIVVTTRGQVLTSRFEPVATVIDQTLPDFIWSASEAGGWDDLVAFECSLTGQIFTHGEVRKYAKAFGASLIRSGLKADESVAILLPNCPEFPIVLMGILEAGLVASPVSPSSTVFELENQLRSIQAKRVVTSGKLLQVAADAVRSLHWSCPIIYVGDGATDADFIFSEMIRTVPTSADLPIAAASFDAREKVALILFSSGTTGPPKGVMLTHSNIATNMLQFMHPDLRTLRSYAECGEQEVVLGILPFCHSFALSSLVLGTLYLGAKCITLPKFQPETFIQTIKTHKFTFVLLVTPLLNFIVSCSEITREDLDQLRAIQTGAAPVGSTLINAFRSKFGHSCEYLEGYGMTELSPASHMTPPNQGKIGSVGLLVPSTQAKIVDPDTGDILGPYKVGELCIKGPQVMKGYFENEVASKETFDSEGYLKTGDLGYVDEEGYFYIVDRLKELIKVKGLQVAPSELENLIRQVPGVADCAVIGVPHKACGEVPRAYVVRGKGDAVVTEEEIGRFLADRVSKYKRLIGGVEFVDAIPKAPSGKILRRELKKAYMDHLGNKGVSKELSADQGWVRGSAQFQRTRGDGKMRERE